MKFLGVKSGRGAFDWRRKAEFRNRLFRRGNQSATENAPSKPLCEVSFRNSGYKPHFESAALLPRLKDVGFHKTP
jgi:hypothetical protein